MLDDAREEEATADVPEPKTTMATATTTRSTLRLYGFYSKEACGYCKTGSASSYGAVCPPGYFVLSKDYEAMMLVGWRRCGSFFYKPNMPVTCCPQYTIRLAVNDFRASRSQRVVLSRVARYCEQNGFVLTVSTLPAVFSEEIFMLYKKYQIAVIDLKNNNLKE
jgi:arginyl-tRNA--protein-N-Asp/Glu arginylyltransferase